MPHSISNPCREITIFLCRLYKRCIISAMSNQDTQFDKEKFMNEAWQRLASMYGVSVEEVKSKEFDKRIEKESEKLRRAEELINQRESAEVQRSVSVGGIVVAIIISLIWFSCAARHRWWFIIPGVMGAFFFISLQEDSIKLVKKEDYPNDLEKYWDRVKSQLVHCQISSAVIAIVVFLLLFFIRPNGN